MAVTVQLPEFVGRSDFADQIVEALAPAPGEAVQVDARHLVSWSAPFAARLVEPVLADVALRTTLTVQRAPRDFAELVQEAAADLGVADRLVVTLVQDDVGAGVAGAAAGRRPRVLPPPA